MNAELLKMRLMALPRWTVVALLLAVVATGVLLDIFPRDDAEGFLGVMSTVARDATEIAAILLGAWAATVEFSAGTLQRTLTAQADRSRVLVAKLVVLVLAVAALGLAVAAAGAGLVEVAASQNGVDLDEGEVARVMFAGVPAPIAVAVIAFGLGLLTRSLGGAITLTLAFIFVLSGFMGLLPSLERIMYSTFESELTAHLAGQVDPGADVHPLPVAALGVVVWAVVLLVPGWFRFLLDDLK